MEWINVRILWPKLKIMKPYLPRSIFSLLEQGLVKPSPTKEQLSEIVRLGKGVGLHHDEIVAAVDAPIGNQGFAPEGKRSLYIPMILISILAVVCALLLWAAIDPRSFPFHTYTPGTFYGTIRPQDFSSRSYTMS